MSALAGIWRQAASIDPPATDCAAMLRAQAVYGPHGVDQWNSDEVALGRRLFRMLPEDLYDQGVVALASGGRMVADVRLDNRDELGDLLGLESSRTRALSDAAMLAEAWGRWGEACFERLLGVYAFAVWDEARRRLILARDPFGGRPLCFHRSSKFVAFASMPVGLHALDQVPPLPDEGHLAAFLALAPERGSGTFFEGIERVEPGGLVVIDRYGVTSSRHYSPRIPRLQLASPQAYAEALREQLDRAVGAQLRGSDREVGAHLSSGWDSAAVASTAARLMALRQGRVLAFTAAPRDGYQGAAPRGRHGDEGPAAARLAALYDNMDHLLVRGTARSPLEDLDRDIALCGRPVLNPCNHVWFNDINRAARARGVTVMLTGDFGNLGLTDDGVEALPDLAAKGRWRQWLQLAAATHRSKVLSWAGIVAYSFENHLFPPLWPFLRRMKGEVLETAGAHSALPRSLWSALSPRPQSREPRPNWAHRRLETLTRLDKGPYLKGALGAFGVDVRDPLADRRLIEFCLSIPTAQLVFDGRTRSLARRALADRLPVDMLEQATRGYQAVDWHEGLMGDTEGVARDLDRLAAMPSARRLLDIDRMRGLASEWPSGGWQRHEVLDAYRMALLRGLAAGRFLSHTLRPNA